MRMPASSILILLAACGSLSARPLVQLTVVDRDAGQTLPVYRHDGERWLPGIPGHRYGVRLRNTSDTRVLVVLSVDGVNAVTGETADPAQAGYVLAPGQETRVDGWRKSLDAVAQFVFTDLPDAYAARTGRPDNIGVIGIAVFEEARPVYEAPAAVADASQAPSSPARAADAESAGAAQAIGTGHGAREWSAVQATTFVRASATPAQVTQWRYDDVHNLVAMGIIPARRWLPSRPDAFPGGFVPDPPQG
jgi:hypothetical protein